jgi:hypothetical protein
MKTKIKQPTTQQVQQAADRRLANLAMELGVAGTQVLIESFGFSQEQAQDWFDKMLARARANRTASANLVIADLQKKATTPR